MREVPAVQQARPRPAPGVIRGHARGGRGAALPKHTQLQEGRFGEGDEARLDEHLLDRAVELLDDVFHYVQLLRRAPGDDQVALVIDHVLGAGEQVGNGSLQGRQGRRQVVDKLIELLNFVDGNSRAGGGRCFGRVRKSEFGGQHEALAQPVKARFLHQPLGVFRVHNPDQLVTDLELQFVVAADVAEEFT